MSDTFNHEADAWDSLLFSDDDDEQPTNWARKQICCKKCGKTQVRWKQHKSGKWWLIDLNSKTGAIQWHSC